MKGQERERLRIIYKFLTLVIGDNGDIYLKYGNSGNN